MMSSVDNPLKQLYPFYICVIITTLLIMSALLDATTLTILIATVAAISGWVTVFYQYLSDRPKIKGKILQVMFGTFPNPEKPSESLTVFTLFLYLTNSRKNVIHISDYILEVETDHKFERMKIVRGFDQPLHFAYGQSEVQFPDFSKGLLIYKQSKPVEFGIPFYGYIIFAGDVKYYKADITRFRITCVDVFDHKHEITTEPKNFVDLFYLQEVFGIKIPKT